MVGRTAEYSEYIAIYSSWSRTVSVLFVIIDYVFILDTQNTNLVASHLFQTLEKQVLSFFENLAQQHNKNLFIRRDIKSKYLFLEYFSQQVLKLFLLNFMCNVLFIWRLDLSMQPLLYSKTLYRLGWPGTHRFLSTAGIQTFLFFYKEDYGDWRDGLAVVHTTVPEHQVQFPTFTSSKQPL